MVRRTPINGNREIKQFNKNVMFRQRPIQTIRTIQKKSALRKDNNNGNDGLTANQKIFVDEWLIDRNGVRAYMLAYPRVKNYNVAGVEAHGQLKKPKVAEYIKKRLAEIAEKAEINQEWVLQRYRMLVDYCIDDFFNDDGSMKSFSEIPKDKLYAIGGFKQSKRTITRKDEEVITDKIKEFKLANKKDVLDSIGKYLGMFEKDNEQRRPTVQIQIAPLDLSDFTDAELMVMEKLGMRANQEIENDAGIS